MSVFSILEKQMTVNKHPKLCKLHDIFRDHMHPNNFTILQHFGALVYQGQHMAQ